ncbi:MAG: carbohydrate-binding domain-containing protein [Bacilli bacterium]|nr:carbohydrate-binding domain-containing protein [Bacilli bacterium]
MKKIKFLLPLIAAGLLIGCTPAAKDNSGESSGNTAITSIDESKHADTSEVPTSSTVEDKNSIEWAAAKKAMSGKEFKLTGPNGGFAKEGNVYNVNVAGDYTVEGYLEGQINVTVDGVKLIFKDTFIQNNEHAAVNFATSGTLKIGAVKDTKNYFINPVLSSYKDAAGMYGKDGTIEYASEAGSAIYCVGSTQHGVKAKKIIFTSGGDFWFQGTNDGSGLNTNNCLSNDEATEVYNIHCVNCKNGIKADKKIELSRGNIFLYNLVTGLKTDENETDVDGVSTDYHITLGAGVKVTHEKVTTLIDTPREDVAGATFDPARA